MRPHPIAVGSVIEAFIGNISHREWKNLPGFFTPDATWWISGNPAHLPPGFPAGPGSASDRLKNLPGLADKFTTYHYDITNLVQEGNKAMVEAQAVGKGPKNLVYVNNITSSYEVDGHGKITKIREYPNEVEIIWLLGQFQNQSKSS